MWSAASHRTFVALARACSAGHLPATVRLLRNKHGRKSKGKRFPGALPTTYIWANQAALGKAFEYVATRAHDILVK